MTPRIFVVAAVAAVSLVASCGGGPLEAQSAAHRDLLRAGEEDDDEDDGDAVMTRAARG